MTINLCQTVAEFRAACERARAQGGKLGLVPTMGALHEGHRSLMLEARRRAGTVAVTIFVNPTQFGPNEDFSKYPRTLERDLETCASAGVDLVFAPPVSEMYPVGERTRVQVSSLTQGLCGASRPGHFDGVTTIVTKLFAVAGPCVAVFGRKDYQQFKVLERMTRDLLLPVEIVGQATVRESDGLALSSRNVFLSPEARAQALAIPQALSEAWAKFAGGERSAFVLRSAVRDRLTRAGLRVDYVELAGADNLDIIPDSGILGERALLALAAFAGNTRLIDNLVFSEDPAPIPSFLTVGKAGQGGAS